MYYMVNYSKQGGRKENIKVSILWNLEVNKSLLTLWKKGYSYRKTTKNINNYLRQTKEVQPSVFCVQESYLRLQPAIIPICKVSQETYNPSSAWSQASFNWSKQLVICFGKLDPHITPDPPQITPPSHVLTPAQVTKNAHDATLVPVRDIAPLSSPFRI